MQTKVPPQTKFVPVVGDQHTAARAYFLCVIGMLFVESMIRLIPLLVHLLNRRKQSSTLKQPPPQNHWTISVWMHKFLTLPSPVPFLTNHTVASINRCLIFTGLNILWGWNRIRYSTDYQLYGWLTIANGGLALLLPTRTNALSIIARIPFPILLMYHRWAGIATVIHASLHFGLTAQKYVQTNQFSTVLENARIRVGIMAWASLALIFLTSLRILRRRTFELFYYTHFVFFVFLAGAFYHAAYSTEFLLPGLSLWAVDRAVRFFYNFRRITVTSVTHYPAGDVTKLKFEGMKTRAPGQIAWVQIPGISALNWHPFTIASAPGEDKADPGTGTGTIAIRSLGGYTKKAMELHDVRKPSSTTTQTDLAAASSIKIRLDGPYGVGRIQYSQFPVVVLVAGGIGVTPAISIASHLVNEVVKRRGSYHIHLLWTLRDGRHLEWFEEELNSLVSRAKDVPITFNISIYITGGRGTQNRGVLVSGEENELGGDMYKYQGPGNIYKGRRPNLMEWFRQIKETLPGLDAAVNLCGPRALTHAARKAAAYTSRKDGLFFVEEEEFEF